MQMPRTCWSWRLERRHQWLAPAVHLAPHRHDDASHVPPCCFAECVPVLIEWTLYD